jgi:hypothetical protein
MKKFKTILEETIIKLFIIALIVGAAMIKRCSNARTDYGRTGNKFNRLIGSPRENTQPLIIEK